MSAPREWTRTQLVAELLRLELIVRDARRKADLIVQLASSAEWDRDMVDPTELRSRVTSLQVTLDKVHQSPLRHRGEAA